MAINSSELRIGNFVNEEVLGNVPVFGIEMETVWIGVKHMDVERNISDQRYHLHLSNINPIPLTPEILESAGFKNRTISVATEYWIGHNPVTSDWLFVISHLDSIGYFYRNGFHTIEYLHQLQNLYFALTGNELPINNLP